MTIIDEEKVALVDNDVETNFLFREGSQKGYSVKLRDYFVVLYGDNRKEGMEQWLNRKT